MGDVNRSRKSKVRAVFILGVNDGNFPSVNREEGFLNDKDRLKLKELNLEFAKGSIEQLYDERFNIYKALSIAEEKLYISYTSTNKEGKAIRPSTLILNIKKIFPKLIEKSDIIEKNEDIILEKLIFKSKDTLKGIEFTNLPQKIDQDLISDLYGNTLRTSISQLEKYRSCPFSFHLKYGLRLKPQVTPNINPVDTGNFMHEVIDCFFDQVKESKIELCDLSETKLEEIVSNIIDKKLQISIHYRLTSNIKFLTLTRKLKKIIIKSIKYIVEQLVNSEFEVLGTELEFKNKGDYPPIILELDNKKKVEIIGKIDRVDLKEAEDGRYIRIIDYKSSVKKIDLNEVLYGLNIQLITYLNEINMQENTQSAGVLYFNLVDYIISSNKKLTEDELEKEIQKQYKMQGILVDDVKIIKMMDTRIENSSYSGAIPVYIDKEGKISPKLSSTLSKKEFENLQKKVIELIKEISKEIFRGDISIKPYYNKYKKTPCEFCEYHSICNFNTKNKGNEYSYIPNLSKEEIIKQLQEGE